MKEFKWSVAWHSVFISLLPLLSLWANGERVCMVGIKTIGYTEPKGEIVIEYGNPLDIVCVLNDEYVQRNGDNSSKNIYFLQDGNNTVPNENIEILNSSSVRLHVQKPRPSITTYFCKVKTQEALVCLNIVLVGYKPSAVYDFKCISYNYENLTCSWTPQKNNVRTKYELTYTFPGRLTHHRLAQSCDVITLSNGKKGCTWSINSNPQYRQAQRTYNFELLSSNVFGTHIFNNTFKHFENVIPAPPENISYLNSTSESIFLCWFIPSSMTTFPPGLHHRILYRSEYEQKEWQLADVLTTPEISLVYFNLTGLKYPNTLYNVKISMRSSVAHPNDESMWSKNSSIIIRTLGKEPSASPETNIYSFEIIPTDNPLYYDIILYWKEILKELKNADNITYHVTINRSRESFEAIETPNLYTRFNKLSNDESYTFRIWSQNEFGRSANESIVVVPKQVNRIGQALNFTKICLRNGKYELTWVLPKLGRVKDYTIFQCLYDNWESPYCNGNINWIQIPSNTTMYKVITPGNKLSTFSISANGENSSSGMVWAYPKIVTFWVSYTNSTSIELRWEMGCDDMIDMVEGYIIYYCNIYAPLISDCKEPEQKLVLREDITTDRAIIIDLKPLEVYRLAIAVDINKSESHRVKSNYLYASTRQA